MESLRKFYMADPGNSGGANPGPTSENVKAAEDMADVFAGMKGDLVDLSKIFAEMGTSIKGTSAYARAQKETVKSLEQELDKAAKNVDKTRKNAAGLGKEFESSKKIQERVNDIKNRQLSIESHILQLERQGVKLDEKQTKAVEKALNILKLQEKVEEKLVEHAQKREKAAGKLGALFQGLTKIPIVGQLIDAERIQDKINKKAEETGSRWRAMGAGIKETFASITDSLSDPLVLATGIVTAFVKLAKLAAEYQSKQFEAAKDLGVSVERGKQLRNSFVDLARANIALGVTADQLQKSYAGVQDQLGFIVKQSQEFNLSTALIERRIGATAEQMAMLQFFAKKTGDTLLKTYKTFSGITKETGARVKLELSEKQALEEVSKVSATVYQNFRGNYKELTGAVIQAKALGTTLDKVAATQSQFLDFESSLMKQFEAETLTSEDLDASQARQYAMQHKTKELMGEINKLIGDNANWNKLSLIDQQAKADLVGMSIEQISEMFREQEKVKVLGEAAGADLQTQYETLVKQHKTRSEIVDLMGQGAASSAQQASVSEKLAATMDAIKQSIAQAATILLPMIEKIVNWLANMENLKKVFTSIAGIMAGMLTYSIGIKLATLATMAATRQQLVMEASIITKEGTVLALKTGQAVAGSIAGAWYLGLGAIAVGAAVAAYLGSAMGGSSGDSGLKAASGFESMSMPDTGMNTAPATSAASTANTSTSYTPSGTNVTSGNGRSAGDVYLDGAKVGQIIFKNANEQQLNVV